MALNVLVLCRVLAIVIKVIVKNCVAFVIVHFRIINVLIGIIVFAIKILLKTTVRVVIVHLRTIFV